MIKFRSNLFKKWICTIPVPSIFIFDLDLTLWDFTVEEDEHIKSNEIFDYSPKERHYMLTHLQELGHELNIGSRSSEPEICKKHLKLLFPNIIFNNMQIYPTPEFKRNHIDAIFKDREITDFYFFDDELNILKDIEIAYPGKAHIFHTPTGLLYETFEQKNSQVTKDKYCTPISKL
jgi:hypothetical protein